MATYYVVWETVAGRGSRAFGSQAEAQAWAADLVDHGIISWWTYTLYDE